MTSKNRENIAKHGSLGPLGVKPNLHTVLVSILMDKFDNLRLQVAHLPRVHVAHLYRPINPWSWGGHLAVTGQKLPVNLPVGTANYQK